jgi:hypothetical protein
LLTRRFLIVDLIEQGSCEVGMLKRSHHTFASPNSNPITQLTKQGTHENMEG